jgi:intein/homing endonuclease
MRYNKLDSVTYKTVDCHGNNEVTHFGVVINTEYNKYVDEEIYVIRTKFGNIVKLTEAEVD